MTHQKDTKALVLKALKALPAWREAAKLWFRATMVIRLHRTELPDQKVDIVAVPLALKELAGFPCPPYTMRLRDGQWYRLGDLVRTTGQWWTTAEAKAEGHLDHAAPPDLLERFVAALPKLWAKLLLREDHLKFRVQEFVARVEDREGGLILEVGRLTKRGEVKPVRWEILPTGEGLMLYPEAKAEKVV